jgi:hypothetical protein
LYFLSIQSCIIVVILPSYRYFCSDIILLYRINVGLLFLLFCSIIKNISTTTNYILYIVNEIYLDVLASMTIIIDGIESSPLNRIPEVKRTQRILLFLISIVFVSSINQKKILKKSFFYRLEYLYS